MKPALLETNHCEETQSEALKLTVASAEFWVTCAFLVNALYLGKNNN